MIEGFTPFTQEEIRFFARAANWTQTALDRNDAKNHRVSKIGNLEPGLHLIEKYNPNQTDIFPSLISIWDKGHCDVIELTSGEIQRFTTKLNHQVLAILN